MVMGVFEIEIVHESDKGRETELTRQMRNRKMNSRNQAIETPPTTVAKMSFNNVPITAWLSRQCLSGLTALVREIAQNTTLCISIKERHA
jgi:hypothetical protein